MKSCNTLISLVVCAAVLLAAVCPCLSGGDAGGSAAACFAESAALPTEAPASMLPYAERLACSFSFPGAEIVVNADVSAPAVRSLPVVATRPHILTPAECSRAVDVLFEGSDLFFGGRSDMEARAAAIQMKLRGDPANQKWLRQLEQVEKELSALPERPIRFEEAIVRQDASTWTADVAGSAGTLRRRLQCSVCGRRNLCTLEFTASDSGEPSVGRVWDANSAEQRQQAQSSGLAGGDLPDPDSVPEPAVSQRQAAECAGEVITALGLPHYVLEQSDLVFGRINRRVQKGWRLRFVQEVAGMPVTFLPSADPDDAATETLRSVPGDGAAGREVLEFLVCDAGIVRLHWETPFVAAGVIRARTVLMPLDKIAEQLPALAPAAWSEAAAAGALTERIEITQAVLCLVHRADEDGSRGVLRPGWCLYGSRRLVSAVPAAAAGSADELLLILDAADGSLLFPSAATRAA